MKQKLTKRVIDSLEPKGRLYKVWDSDVGGFFIKVRPSGTKTFGIWYRVHGKAAEYTIGKYGNLTVDEARKIAKKKSGQVADDQDVQAQRQEKRRAAKAKQVRTVERFLEDRYQPGHLASLKSGADTVHRIKTVWKHLLGRDMASITAEEIGNWRGERLKQGKAVATINRDVAALRGLLSKAVRWGVLDAHPLAKLDPSNLKMDDQAKTRFLTPDENTALREALDAREAELHAARESGNAWRRQRNKRELPPLGWFADHLKPIVLLALNTGMRRGEILSLQWSNVNFAEKLITIEGRHAKSKRTRHISMNAEVVDVLRRWQRQSGEKGLVFPGKEGDALGEIKSSWRGLMKRAKLKDFRFHDLRHDFASQLVKMGVPLATVRELLGHADFKTTLRYAHLADEDKAAAVAKLVKGAGS